MAPASDFDPQLLGADEPICPYTGLRTFTEDEAIYFRGREGHVANCLALLAQQHFVMVTGASGDGKSSLVFAGMLPEVRAGFVRARYGSWAVATCRPERTPLRNLAAALAEALRLPGHAGTVETELQQGFSALVQLYEASALCPAAPDPALPPAEQRRRLRPAANLLLVVDQFEEFFTNPENYDGAAPNAAAQTVVNLLLETARLARERELPIYIVCTMRSDFVGQCAEFRGLIEQVGASQYFVPRLLRHEFVQVIRDPAELSGNRISERLTQRLLFDTNQGQDQLPVLQHTLRRIWLAAGRGRQQMDLLHYAMVGGLSGELPAPDQPRFAAWQATLPAGHAAFLLASPSLRNVLDAHANQLYAEAGARYNHDFAPPLPPGTAERVIELAFRVLTRTDGKRVVRNRLTGAEITAIIDEEALPWPVVCRILRPFREADATFLQPFIGEDDDPQAVLPPETVLDITHESLIRNWQLLSNWAATEAREMRFATNLLQEAQRWQENGESKGFLLPIGLYSVFAQWVKGKRGLTAWLAYYFDAGPDPAQRLPHAAQQHTLLARYLQASRRRLRAQLVLARYGVWRLVLAVLLPLLLGGLGWAGWQWRTRQADYVAYHTVDERAPLLASSFVPVQEKARFLLAADRLGNFAYQPWLGGRRPADYAFPRMLDALHNDTLALGIGLSMYAAVDAGNLSYDLVDRENPAARRILADLVARLGQGGSLAPRTGPPTQLPRQRARAVLAARTVMALTHYLLSIKQLRTAHPAPAGEARPYEASRARLLRELRAYVQQEVQTTRGPAPSPVAFGYCLRVLLGQGSFSADSLAFLQGMNPYGTAAAARQFGRLYPAGLYSYVNDGYTGHSGGYLTAAIVLAALHQPRQLSQCLQQLGKDVSNVRELNGAFGLLPYLVKYGLLTPDNPQRTYELLKQASQVGGFSFNEVYAALAYSLLSVRPGTFSHDVSQEYSNSSINQIDAVRLGGVNPRYLNVDHLSYSIPLAARDQAWQALLAATPVIAENEPIFSPYTIPRAGIRPPTSAELAQLQLQQQRMLAMTHAPGMALFNLATSGLKRLFLAAFVQGLHGVYLHELRHQPAESAAALIQAAAAADSLNRIEHFDLYASLQRPVASLSLLDAAGLLAAAQPHPTINPREWNLGLEQEKATQTGAYGQDPIQFLRQVTRPKTMAFQNYYTCPFDVFFVSELQRATNPATPDPALVHQLDSVALAEAVFPDRFSDTRDQPFWDAALNRSAQYQPNLTWLRAVAHYQLPGDTLRQRRNALLLAVSEALQDSARLRGVRLTPALGQFIRGLGQAPAYRQEGFQLLFSNLATALAASGRLAEAFALTNQLGPSLATPTKLRVAEQAMLAGNYQQQELLDSFLLHYSLYIRRKPGITPVNTFALLYWRPYANTHLNAELQDLLSLLTEKVSIPFLDCERAIGLSLADEAYSATQLAPSFQPEKQRQLYYNNVLLGLAHRHTPAAGWREYDELLFTSPIPGTPDYDGPVN